MKSISDIKSELGRGRRHPCRRFVMKIDFVKFKRLS
jgi:hypothetical protein